MQRLTVMKRSKRQVRDALLRALKLIENEENFTSYDNAQNAKGERVSIGDSQAVKWSLTAAVTLGSVNAPATWGTDYTLEKQAVNKLNKYLRYPVWSNRNEHAAVVKGLIYATMDLTRKIECNQK